MFIILTIMGLISLFIGIKVTNKGKKNDDSDTTIVGRGFWIGGLSVTVLFGFLFLGRCIQSVDAGEVAIQVQFGKVLNAELTEGLNFKNPLADVYSYNIQLRETTMDVKDGNALQALTSDKLSVLLDATIWWKIIGRETRMIYRTISADESKLDDIVVFPAIRSAVRDAVVNYTFDEIITKRGELAKKIDDVLIELTKGKGVVIERVLIRNVSPEDAKVTASIGQKLQEQQQLQAKQYELQKAEMNAKIRIKDAEGIATAQNIIQKTLTSEYLQFEGIQMMKTLAHAPNTTFIFVPMSSKESGIPMVYSLKDFETKK